VSVVKDRDPGLVESLSHHYPDLQAVYVFGTYGTEDERPESDADIALLLPVQSAKRAGNLALGPCAGELCSLLGREIDLINLRRVDTVFQFEIIRTGRIVFEQNDGERESFELLTIAKYQKLSEERSGIIEEILRSGRVYDT
jgi:predicted nucleotidyltransferase